MGYNEFDQRRQHFADWQSERDKHRERGDIDPDGACCMAARLAARADAVARMASAMHRGAGPIRRRTGLGGGRFRQEDGHWKIRLISHHSHIRGLGDLSVAGDAVINFDYDTGDAFARAIKKRYGVASRVILSVSVHTDRATLPAIERMLAEHRTSREALSTRYVFDAAGDAAKAVKLPRTLDDARPVLSRDQWYQHVRADLTPEDYELAGGMLATFERHLRQRPESV